MMMGGRKMTMERKLERKRDGERERGRRTGQGRQGRANTFVARSECSAGLGLGLAGLLQPAWQLSIFKASIDIEANRSLTGSLPCSLLHTSDVDKESNCSSMRCVLYLCRTSIWKSQCLSGLLLEK
jgi:hypothetical protein